jgi:3-deoxy-D-manno-octulosonic acid kinase
MACVITPPGFERVRTRRTLIVVRSEGRAWLVPLLASAARGQTAAQEVGGLSGGRGGAVLIRAHGHAVVLRPCRRGGLPAWVLHATYFGWSLRPLRELYRLEQLRLEGLPVVEPLGACVRWVLPGCYRGWIVTRYVPGACTMWEWAATAPTDDDRAAVWHQVGAAIRQLHRAGGRHPDLNLHNILLYPVAGSLRALFVDFDQPRFSVRFCSAAGELARLGRSARKLDPDGRLITAGDIEHLLRAYHE